ncbi:MAG: arginine/agmatine antiporter [Puniceicoccales bacterium]
MGLAKHAGKVGVVPATLMVAGNIMGSGVFMLPANLAATGGIAIYGWLVTITGAVCLALVYAKMSAIDDSPGGSYAYARRSFGPFVGYQTNLLYWLGSWIGNVALAVVGVGYLSYFIPALNAPWVLAIACLAMIWLFTFINILGPRLTAHVQSVATILALVAIVGVAILGWFKFSGETYMAAWNVSGKGDFAAIQGVLNVTLWSFIGVETAAVAAGVVDNPKKNVPIATIGGVVLAAVTYVLSCTAIMGAIPNEQLVKSAAPFADCAKLVFGEIGGAAVSICAAVGCLGSLGGWILATAQTAKAAADDGLFPKIFGHQNKHGVPVKGLLIVAVLMTATQLLTVSPSASKEFGVISSIAVLMTVVAYLYVASALIRFIGSERRKWLTGTIIFITLAYCSWAMIGSNAKQVAWLAVCIMISAACYSFNRLRRDDEPPHEHEGKPEHALPPAAEPRR